jgi:hypothetical protein
MADTNKCAHPVCKCTVPKDGAYGTTAVQISARIRNLDGLSH